MKVISKRTRNGGTIISNLIAEDKNPHIKSLGALILLNYELQLQDEDFLNDDLYTWLKFRHEYLSEILKEKGVLTCSYCPKNKSGNWRGTPRRL